MSELDSTEKVFKCRHRKTLVCVSSETAKRAQTDIQSLCHYEHQSEKHLKLCKLNEIVQNQVNSGKFGGNLPCGRWRAGPQASANQQKSRWHLFEKQI